MEESKVVIGLIIMLLSLQIVKLYAPRYAMIYVTLILGSLLLAKRSQIAVFVANLQSRLR
jgi:uncharacterized membrane protein